MLEDFLIAYDSEFKRSDFKVSWNWNSEYMQMLGNFHKVQICTQKPNVASRMSYHGGARCCYKF